MWEPIWLSTASAARGASPGCQTAALRDKGWEALELEASRPHLPVCQNLSNFGRNFLYGASVPHVKRREERRKSGLTSEIWVLMDGRWSKL